MQIIEDVTAEQLTEIERRIADYCASKGLELVPGHIWGWDGLGSRYCDIYDGDDVSISVRVSDHSPTGSGSQCDVYIYPSDLTIWDSEPFGAVARIGAELEWARINAEDE